MLKLTKEDYVKVRDNPLEDTLPIIHYYFLWKGRTSLTLQEFNFALSTWLNGVVGLQRMSSIQYKVFNEFDKYFGLI